MEGCGMCIVYWQVWYSDKCSVMSVQRSTVLWCSGIVLQDGGATHDSVSTTVQCLVHYAV